MAHRLHIVIDDAIPFIRGVLEPFFRVTYLPGSEITSQDLKEVSGIIVRTRTLCNQALLENTGVRFVATATVGTDHLDLVYLKENQIEWMHAAGCNANSVCQYVLAAIFEILLQTKKTFKETTLGIVGAGAIGSRLHRLASALQMRCLICDPPLAAQKENSDFSNLDDILDQSDIVSLHVPLTTAGPHPTHHRIGDIEIKRMRSNAFLINTSRGPVVDNEALSYHLKSKTIAGAVLDVWEGEPNPDLTLLKQVLIGTPHIAGYSLDGKVNASIQVVRALAQYFRIDELKAFQLKLDPPESPAITGVFETEKLEFLHSVYKQAYDINRDSSLLKRSPAQFEEFRKNYPIRREPSAFILKADLYNEDNRDILQKLGFNLCV